MSGPSFFYEYEESEDCCAGTSEDDISTAYEEAQSPMFVSAAQPRRVKIIRQPEKPVLLVQECDPLGQLTSVTGYIEGLLGLTLPQKSI